MKILFMGTPDFAVGILDAIVNGDVGEVVGVVTQPDKPKGRSSVLIPSPVKEYALSHGIKVYQPAKIKASEEVEILRGIDADIYVVAAFGQILSKEILDIPRYGCINVHASLLPQYRGAAPIQWAIYDGKEYTGVTIQQMNEGVDTGDIISQERVKIADDETGESLFTKLRDAGAKLIVHTLQSIGNNTAQSVPQDESKATYARILKKEMGCIDFTRTAEEIERMIRAFTPWPGGFTYLNGRILKIKQCKAEAMSVNETGCGFVTGTSREGIRVACGGGTVLLITRLQPEGKKEMPAADFLLGNKIPEGTKLG